MLSPLLPKNKTLSEMSDDDFYDAMDEWTLAAMAPPYVDSVKEVTMEETIPAVLA